MSEEACIMGHNMTDYHSSNYFIFRFNILWFTSSEWLKTLYKAFLDYKLNLVELFGDINYEICECASIILNFHARKLKVVMSVTVENNQNQLFLYLLIRKHIRSVLWHVNWQLGCKIIIYNYEKGISGLKNWFIWTEY